MRIATVARKTEPPLTNKFVLLCNTPLSKKNIAEINPTAVKTILKILTTHIKMKLIGVQNLCRKIELNNFTLFIISEYFGTPFEI